MTGTTPSASPEEQRLTEHHLGDRLAALVDGELGHDARERVLAHLATCTRCKAEADAQRTLKSVFAAAAPPPPSAGLLARLQGLPGQPGGGDDRGGPFDDLLRAGGVRSDGFATAAPVTPDTGFRIHEVGDRGSGRGRRFAFAAASAVSFAAIALSSTLSIDAPRPGQGTGNNVTPLRAPATFASGSRRETLPETAPATLPVTAPATLVPARLELSPFAPPMNPVMRLAYEPGYPTASPAPGPSHR
ncbi:anti-sigma factor family protein [Streptomyces sp. NPDC090025]|uniref:anti-sigma factor family protein n=1 Tax=Streptomyces sp. NPDC090025 TaxID=3365922 RepID=UPI0038383212